MDFDDEIDIEPLVSGMEHTSNDRLWAALGYPIPLFALVAIMLEDKKYIPFVRYHAIQALIFGIVLWSAILIFGILTLGIGSMCAPVIWLISLWPAYDAYRGNYTEIPVISNFIKNRGWVE